MRKFALFAFNGEMMCFVHVLLNALDMHSKGHEVALVIEGSATKLVPELVKEDNPFSSMYQKVKASGLIAGACKACSNKMGVLEDVETEGLELLADMSGHPGMASYLQQGYEIITF